MREEVQAPGPPADFGAEKTGRAGVVTLGSLTAEVRQTLDGALEAFGRDPHIYCAILRGRFDAVNATGGPVGGSKAALLAAYQSLWRIDRFSKPIVSLMAGQVAWPGLALVLTGTHKIADPAAVFSIRDTAGGGIPGWGASYHLPALPRQLGLYLALTGASIDSALAYELGWLTHRIAAEQFAGIEAQLANAEPVDQLLDQLDEGPAVSAIEPYRAAIDRCFSAKTAEAILARLDGTAGAEADWARTAAAAMRAAPPLALAATHRLLTAHTQADLRNGLILDHRIAVNGLATAWPADHFDRLCAVPASGDAMLAVTRPPSIG